MLALSCMVKYSAVVTWTSLFESDGCPTIVLDTLGIPQLGYAYFAHKYMFDLFAFQRRRSLVCMREWRGAALEGLAASVVLSHSRTTKNPTSP